MNHKLLVVLVVLLSATHAQAGSKLSMTVVPTPPDCFIAGSFCLNSGASCFTDNSECALAGVSAKSTVSLSGKLLLKGSFKEVRDTTGALVNTGLVGAADNYVVQIGLQTCTVDASEMPYCGMVNQDVYVKLALSKGKGSFKLDLNPVFPAIPNFPAGTPLRINHVALITPRAGGNCLGTNSGADLLARLNDATCNDGIGILGVGGIATQQ
jgi:hypothetical protein